MKYYRTILIAVSVLLAITMLIVLYTPAESARLVGLVPDAAENAICAYNFLQTGKFGIYLDGVFYPSRYLPWFQLTVLAPGIKLFGGDLFSCTYILELCALATIILAVFLIRKLDSFPAALLAVPSFLLYPEFRYYSCHALTEAPYILFLLCMLALYLNMVAAQSTPHIRTLALFAILTAWAGSFRITACPMLLLPGLLVLFRCGTRKQKAFKILLLGIPSCLMLCATCLYNHAVFGSPFRNGYNFWCPVPHDFSNLLFHPRFLGHNLQLLAHHEALWLCLIIGAALFFFTKKLKRQSDDAFGCQSFTLCTHAFLFALCQFVILLFLYMPYYGTHDRYLHPAGLLFLIPLICIFAGVVRTVFAKKCADPRRISLIFPMLAILLQYIVILGPQAPKGDVNVELAEVESLRFCDRVLPDDAIVITTYDTAMADFIFVRDTARRQLPAFRDFPYAYYITSMEDTSAFFTPPADTDPYDTKVAFPIIEHGAILPFPRVMTDEDPYLAQRYGTDWYLPEPAFSEGRIYVTNFSLLQMQQDRAERLKEHAILQSIAKDGLFEIYQLLPLTARPPTE